MKKGSTALVIVDAQVGLIEGNHDNEPLFNKDLLLKTMQKIVKDARNRSIPLIYVQDYDVAEQGTREFEVHPIVAPEEDEIVIVKRYTDCFRETALHEKLQQLAVDHIVVMGAKTEYCVDTTCRRAVTLGYDVTLVSDGHSTTDNGVLTADQIIAHHNRNLRGFDSIEAFIFPRPSEEDVLTPIHNNYRE